MKYLQIITTLLIFCTGLVFSQTNNIGIGTDTPDVSAILHLESTDKGLLIPRTDTAAISSPADGLLIYMADSRFWYFDGMANIWKPLPASQDLTLNGTTLGLTNSSVTVSLPSGGAAPQGIIVMWSGTIANIPAGWALCDGTNGTPNLSDRFVVGAGTGVNPGGTGGANTYSLTSGQLPSHTHTGSGSTSTQGDHAHTGNTANAGLHGHTGTVGNAGDHRHTAYESASTGASGSNKQVQNVAGYTGYAGDHTHPLTIDGNGDHAHAFSTNTTGSHSHSFNFTTDSTGSGLAIDNRPSYYEIAFIMKL